MARRSKDWRSMGCAALVGAIIALPAGIIIGSNRAASERPNASASAQKQRSAARDVYTPEFRSDPYVLQEQGRIVEALELSCRQSNLHCEEARQARLRIEEARNER